MAVSLSIKDLAVALRVVTERAEYDALPGGQTEVLSRTHAAACALVNGYAPAAPVDVANEATVRAAGWLYDVAPHESARQWSVLKHSGAAGLLSPWRVRRLSGSHHDLALVTRERRRGTPVGRRRDAHGSGSGAAGRGS